ncbi:MULTISPECIES: AAA family ATPase [Streptomyces]|uniref:AAA family ATPase n=1 Tax=Streptomyces TaxID=1883 RepID=UPI000998957B|nr:AAA family ATPase [Streptomyces sp. NRRL S-475]
MSGTEPRRYLIATAISHYPSAPAELEWDRPGLVEARRRIVELFTRELGYTHASDLGLNPTKNQLARELREFCRSPERRADDVIAVYIAGHGEVLDNGDYVLLTADTEPDDLYDALLPSTLARKILAGTKVRRLLLMLDTCFSGQAGNELLAAMARLKNDWREDEAGLAVITSAQPKELAQTGAFPELLAEAVTSFATAGYTPPLLALDAVVNATRTNPKRPDFQHIGLEIIGLTGEIPPFLPNAKHSNRLSHTDLALQQAAEWDEQDKRRDVEFRTRLLRRAMGHSDPSRVGWWFSGRHQALRDITEWLADPAAEGRPALVVTGAPGSGKTAVLGLLAAVSDPEYRRTVPLASIGVRSSQLPRPKAIGTTVYAQSLTDQQIVRAVAAALRLPQVEAVADLLNQLGARPAPDRPHVVLVDGLDEAATPASLCAQVLRPLMELAAPHLRLLLGTRPHLFTALGLHPDDHIDLDSPRYADPEAVLVYTVRNLLDAHPDSPYVDCPREIRLGVAHAVAAAAGTCFLVARITAGTLAATPVLPDPTDPTWRRALPSAAADAMHRDLHQRFGGDAARILALLRPLAYAEGQGLPWEDIWAPLASELAGRPYTNDDLHQLRRDAGAYVVEAVEDGRSVYRLYHESMAEYLRQGQDAPRVQRAFTQVLRRSVAYAVDGLPDWARAHPYTLRHLATHAAAAGLLDTLLSDIEYLVHADYDTLMPCLLEAESDEAQLNTAVFRSCLHVLRHLDAAARRQVLAVEAARFNVPHLVEALNARADRRAWTPVAASGGQVSSNLRNALTGHTGLVKGLACTEVNGRPIAVTGSQDLTVRMWDLITGDPVGTPMTGHTKEIEAVACTEVNGRPVAVSVSRDQTVRVWDLEAGRAAGEPMRGHSDAIHAVACSHLDGYPVAVTGSWDGTARVWDLTTGQAVGGPVSGTGMVNTLACGVLDGRPVVATGSTDSLRLWDLTTRRRVARLDRTWDSDWYNAVVFAELDGRTVVVTADRRGRVRVWDPQRRRVTAEFTGHEGWASSVACAVMDGRQVAVAGYEHGTAQIWDLEDGHPVGPPIGGHAFPLLNVAWAELAGQPVVITSAYDTLRVWDPSQRGFGRPVVGHTQRVLAVDQAVLDGRPVIVTGSQDSTLRSWYLSPDFHSTEPVTHHEGEVATVTCTVVNGRQVAVSSSRSATVVWDIAAGRAAHPPFVNEEDSSARTRCVRLNGREVLVTGRMEGSVRLRDLATGEPTERYTAGRTGVWTDYCVIDGHLVLAAASVDAPLRVKDVATGRTLGETANSHLFRALTIGWLKDRHVVVTGTEAGTVHLWELPGCRPLGEPLTGHTRSVWSVGLTELDGRPVALTGSADNTVRIWDLEHRSTLAVIHLPGPCRAVSLSEDGLLVCAFGNDIAVFTRR